VISTSVVNNQSSKADLSEWLRSLTRNQMGSSRAGSNPAVSEYFLTKATWPWRVFVFSVLFSFSEQKSDQFIRFNLAV
jgi:hypothetical protein